MPIRGLHAIALTVVMIASTSSLFAAGKQFISLT